MTHGSEMKWQQYVYDLGAWLFTIKSVRVHGCESCVLALDLEGIKLSFPAAIMRVMNLLWASLGLCVYLAALAGNAAVVVTRGLVATHHTWLILFEVAGNVPWKRKNQWKDRSCVSHRCCGRASIKQLHPTTAEVLHHRRPYLFVLLYITVNSNLWIRK